MCNWFQPENNNIDVFLLMNGNILNHPLASKQYNWNEYSAYATPPTSTSTITGKPPPAQSHINTYNTAFNQETSSFSGNYQKALNNYHQFSPNDINSNFIPGTFGYAEEYNSISQSLYIKRLQDDASLYAETPYLFISAGSGGGPGFTYLNWIIVTYGVPYVVSIS